MRALAAAVAALTAAASLAAEPQPAPYLELAQLETVTIIGDPVDPKSTTGSAYVVSKEDLEKFEHTNVHSILRGVPGVYVRDEDGLGVYPRIGIRASSAGRSDRISLLEDGIPAAMAPYADPSAYYFPNVGRMSTVEVLKGPEILKYGPQTTSGALNLVSTPIADSARGFVNAETGSFDARKIHGYFSDTLGEQNPSGQWGWLLETYQQETDGFQKIDRSNIDAGRDIDEWMGKLRWKSAEGATFGQQVDLKIVKGDEVANVSYLGLTDEDFRNNPNRRYGLSELEQMQRGRDSASLRYQIAFSEAHSLTATAYRNETYRNYTRLNQINGIGIGANGVTSRINTNGTDADLLQGILDGTADTTHANGVRYGHNLRDFVSEGLQLDWLSTLSLAGIEHEISASVRRHEDERNDLASSNTSYDQINGSLVFSTYSAGTWATGEAEATTLWLSDRIRMGSLTLMPLVRFEEIDTDANIADPASASNSLSKTAFGFGANYALSDSWTALAGIHEGFAPPGVTAGEGEKGEESLNYESGLRFRSPELVVDAIAFYSDYTNALRNCLVANPCPGGAVDGTQKTGSKDVYGLELRLASELFSRNSLSIPFALNYTYSDGEYSKDSDTGNVLKDDVLDYTPKHIASAELGLESTAGWRINLVANYTDSMCITTTCERDGVDARYLETESLWTIDLAGTYAYTDTVDFYLKADNLFDEQAITHRGADGARGNMGRNLALGARLKF